MIDILINIPVVFQIRVFGNLLVHVLFPDISDHLHDQEPICVQNCEKLTLPPPIFVFCQSKTAFKNIEDPIANQKMQ